MSLLDGRADLLLYMYIHEGKLDTNESPFFFFFALKPPHLPDIASVFYSNIHGCVFA